jgi:hypothetical protein
VIVRLRYQHSEKRPANKINIFHVACFFWPKGVKKIGPVCAANRDRPVITRYLTNANATLLPAGGLFSGCDAFMRFAALSQAESSPPSPLFLIIHGPPLAFVD